MHLPLQQVFKIIMSPESTFYKLHSDIYFAKVLSLAMRVRTIFRKTLLKVYSTLNNVSTVTDYNFKATELKVIPQYCIANTYCSRFLRHWHPQMSVCLYTTKEISLKLSSITKFITYRAKLLNADWLRQRAFFLNHDLEGTFGNQERA